MREEDKEEVKQLFFFLLMKHSASFIRQSYEIGQNKQSQMRKTKN